MQSPPTDEVEEEQSEPMQSPPMDAVAIEQSPPMQSEDVDLQSPPMQSDDSDLQSPFTQLLESEELVQTPFLHLYEDMEDCELRSEPSSIKQFADPYRARAVRNRGGHGGANEGREESERSGTEVHLG
jgi:hypothetical protein